MYNIFISIGIRKTLGIIKIFHETLTPTFHFVYDLDVKRLLKI